LNKVVDYRRVVMYNQIMENTVIDFSDSKEQTFETLRYNRATPAQCRAAKRFSSEARDPNLTVSQAVKRLQECFYVLDKAKAAGISFADAWDQYINS